MPAEPSIRARHQLPAAEIEALEDELYAFNAARTGRSDGQGLAFVAELAGGRIGAVAGYSWAGMAELRQVWVREDWRGRGLGRALMAEAVAEARRRGCRVVFLTTFGFQAPGFYRKLGFEPAAEIRDKPPGHSEFVMRLDLGA